MTIYGTGMVLLGVSLPLGIAMGLVGVFGVYYEYDNKG